MQIRILITSYYVIPFYEAYMTSLSNITFQMDYFKILTRNICGFYCHGQ